jgi:hypothetical protein
MVSVNRGRGARWDNWLIDAPNKRSLTVFDYKDSLVETIHDGVFPMNWALQQLAC